jgi:hypothetical protein
MLEKVTTALTVIAFHFPHPFISKRLSGKVALDMRRVFSILLDVLLEKILLRFIFSELHTSYI